MKRKPLWIVMLLLLFYIPMNSERISLKIEEDIFSFSDYLELVNDVKQFHLYRKTLKESNGYVHSAFFACQFLNNELFLMPEAYFESHQKEFLNIKKVKKLLPNDPFVIVFFERKFQENNDEEDFTETRNWYSKLRREVMASLWNMNFNLEDYKRVLSFLEENLDLYIIRQNKEITMSDLNYAAAMGFMLSLDGYSKVYKKRRHKFQIEPNQNRIAGVGMILRLGANREVRVESPLEDSPAHKSGIYRNDIILKINDRDVRDLDFEEVIQLQKGKPGSIVKFEIKRESINRILSISVKREFLAYGIVKGELFPFDPEVAVIRVFRWEDKNISVAKEIHLEYDRLLKQTKDQNRKLKGIILDFRSLRGGTIESIADTLDLFIKDALLFRVKNERGEVADRFAKGNEPIELPLAILVDRNTSSGGEVIAGSLQYHKRAIVMGERTSGNAALVSTFDFSNNQSYGMEILDSLYYFPSEISFHEIGILPDIQITSEFGGSNLLIRKEEIDRNHSSFAEMEESRNSQIPLEEIQAWVKVNGKANVEIERRKNDPIRSDDFLFHAVDAFNGYLLTLNSVKRIEGEKTKE
ncbi:PDZ domain-containing protein [Leptospira jelokensis]|nr:PDZ domain-containing protein [Leptospira jelokensis]